MGFQRSRGYEVLGVRELSADEVKHLKRAKLPAFKRLRHAHHRLALLIATGMTGAEIAVITGYSENRIAMLKADPAFKELIATKLGLIEAASVDQIAEYNQLILTNGIKAEQLIADKLDSALDAEDDDIPWAVLLKASRDAADRVGLAKRSVALNVNVDFASQLQKAVQRSRLKIVDGTTAAPTTVVPMQGRVPEPVVLESSPASVLIHREVNPRAGPQPPSSPPLSVSRRTA